MKFTGEFFVPDEKFRKVSEDRELAIEHLQRYNTILSIVAGKDVLDIASGEGYGSSILAEKASKVTGVDINGELVEHASAKYKKDNLIFKHGSATSIPVEDNSVDIVISFETLEHLSKEDQVKFIIEISRVLRKEGALVVSTPNKENYSDRFNFTNEFHAHELDEPSFVSLLESAFPQVELFSQGQEIVSLVLNKNRYKNNGSLQVIPIEKDHFRLQGKYLLAVCSKSEKKQGSDISSIVVEGNKSFFDLIERIVQLQKEVEELGPWGKRASDEADELRKQLEELVTQRDKIREDNEIVYLQNKNYIQQLQEQASGQKRIIEDLQNDKFQLNEELQKTVVEKHNAEENVFTLSGRNASLTREIEEIKNSSYRLETQKTQLEGKLQLIYESGGWKALSMYYKLKGKILPENSWRYKTLKKWYYFIKTGKKVPALVVGPSAPAVENNSFKIPEINIDIDFPVAFPVFDDVKVSIVIPAYNNWEFTKNCLLSIHKFNDGIPFEVIVGDNVSTDETQRFNEYFTNVNYIRNAENLGYIKNVNNAASKARGTYILTLNNDTTVTEGWLINLVKIMESDSKAGLVGSKLVYPNGSLQEAGGIIWNDASGWNFGRTSDPELPQFNYVKETDYISGASNLVRRELWEKLNGLDLRYVPAYFDDSDLAFGIRKLGYKVIYQPLSVVIHYEGLTHGTDTAGGTKQYQVVNRKKFIEKWKDVLQAENFPNGEKVFWARDRSRNKKTILIIDHYVPHFDKDAGSRTTYQLLQLFVEMDYNVKFIGDNFYKHEPYTTILQQASIEVLHGPYYRDNWQKWVQENSAMIDIIYLNRPHISIKYIDFLKENTKAKIIYYGHDLHFKREQSQYEIEKNPKLLESMKEWKQIETYLIQKSDAVLTLSHEEKDIMENELGAANVKIMPAFFYNDFKPEVLSFLNRKDILFIAGFNHKPNVDAVLWFANEVWPQVTAVLKNIRFIIVGSLVPDEVAKLESSTISVKGYVTDDELNEIYNSVRMVVVPLRYGGGVKGKTVEAMYHGLPVVTTSFGIEGLKNIETVLQPCDDSAAFANRIISLYNNEKELMALSEKEVNYAKTHFSKNVVKKLIAETF